MALTEAQIRMIEGEYPDGFTSQQLIAAFEERDVRFSEANLRRYVQLGLVPRSRRVGKKGKHQGSKGVYPVRSVRRINTIKKLMADHFTLEEIQSRFLVFKDNIETLDEALAELLLLFESRISADPPSGQRDRLTQELGTVRRLADDVMTGVQRLEKLLISSDIKHRPRGGGAASPTELLE